MKTDNKLKRKRILFYFIIVALFFIFIKTTIKPLFFNKLSLYINRSPEVLEHVFSRNTNVDNENSKNSSLYSSNIYLLNRNTGEVLLNKNGEETIYPASMTKIMSILVGIEHLQDLDRVVSLPKEIRNLQLIHASVAGFSIGEWVTVRDLFYATLIPSGADACLGIVYSVCESEEEFVGLMNSKAKEIGMKNTHFTGPIGFYDSNHYTTAKDMAILFDYVLENPIFYKLITTKNYTTSSTDNHPKGISLESTLWDSEVSTQLKNGEILGGKTGTTREAGRCLTSFAKIKGETYILVTAGAHGPKEEETDYHIMDAVSIYNSI